MMEREPVEWLVKANCGAERFSEGAQVFHINRQGSNVIAPLKKAICSHLAEKDPELSNLHVGISYCVGKMSGTSPQTLRNSTSPTRDKHPYHEPRFDQQELLLLFGIF